MRRLLYIRGTSSLFASHVCLGLKQYWQVIRVINPFRIPIFVKAYYVFKNFHPNRSIWSRQYHYDSFSYYKRRSSFYKRSRWISQKLDSQKDNIDAIFQTGAYCLPSLRRLYVPYTIYIDFTTKLADQQYPLWANFRTVKEKQEWTELERQVYEAADRIFTFNEDARTSVIKDYRITPEKVIKVGAGVTLSRVEMSNRSYDSRTILFSGRDFNRHGGETVLEAFELVQAELPQAELIIAGSHFETHNPQIRTLGAVTHTALQDLYQRSTVVALPAKVGGFQTLTEAMGYRCVCVTASGNPHLSDLIRDGETGFCISPDPVKLAEKIIFVLKHPDVQRSVGRQAAEHVMANFTWPVVTEKISREMAKLL